MLGVLAMVLMGEFISIVAGKILLIIIFLLLNLILFGLILKKKVWKWYLIFPWFMIAAFLRMEWAAQSSGISSDTKYHIEGKVEKIVDKGNYRQIYVYDAKIYPVEISGKEQEKVDWSANMSTLNDAGETVIVEQILKGILVQASDMNEEIIYGDVISCTGYLRDFEEAKNPGNFDSRQYYETLNIEKYIWTDNVELVKKNESGWIAGIFWLKKSLTESFQEISIGTDAGIYSSLVLGDKSMLDANIKELYQVNGIAHILAISGLHVSILGMGFYKLLRKCCIPFLPCFIVSFFVILSYGIMTGNSASTVRAIVMFLMAIFADVLGRTYDILSGLALSASILILIYPKIIFNSGFQLSFLAVTGIVVIKPALDYVFGNDRERQQEIKRLERRKGRREFGKRVWSLMLSSMTASLAVTITTFPVILYSYFEAPLYSVFLNMLILPFMTFLMISAVCGGFAGLFCVPLGAFCAGTGHFILMFYEGICNLFLKLPHSVVIFGRPEGAAIVIYYVILAGSLFFVQKSRKVIGFLTGAAVCILLIRFSPEYQVRMLDVGQGDSIHISSDGMNLLVDGGSTSEKKVGQYRILPYLKSEGVRKIDFMVMSHADADHVNGLVEILEDGQIKVDYLIMPKVWEKSEKYQKLEETAKKAGVKIQYLSAGDEFICGKIQVKCLHPTKDYRYESENDYSLVLHLEYKGLDMLLTGDVEDAGENRMILEDVLKDIEILKVSHHGSRYSTDEEFLEAVSPEIALISCGKDNLYGHPHTELMNRLKTVGASTFVTKDYGAITIEFGEGIEVYGFTK